MNTDTLDALVREYTQLGDAIATLTERQDAIKAELRTLDPGKHETTMGLSVSVSVPNRFNAKRAAAELPPEVVAQCSDFSGAKAKQVLAPAAYAAFCEPGTPVVKVV